MQYLFTVAITRRSTYLYEERYIPEVKMEIIIIAVPKNENFILIMLYKISSVHVLISIISVASFILLLTLYTL